MKIQFLLFIAALLSFHTRAHAQSVANAPADDQWLGTWQLRREVVYSTCPKVAIGDIHVLSLTVSRAAGHLVGRETNESDGRITAYKADTLGKVLTFRNGTRLGLDLWTQSDEVLGRTVEAGKNCVVVGRIATLQQEFGVLISNKRVEVGMADARLARDEVFEAEITRRIRANHIGGINRCYERHLQNDPSAGGSVIVRLAIGNDGAVERAAAKSTSKELSTCMKDRAKAWTFSPLANDTQASAADFELTLSLTPPPSIPAKILQPGTTSAE